MIIGNGAQHGLANIAGHFNQDHLLNSMATGETSKKKHYSLYASIEVREKDLQKLIVDNTELTIDNFNLAQGAALGVLFQPFSTQ